MLLTHTFAGLPDALRLTTAVLRHSASRGAALLASIFGAGVHVALQREGCDACVYTDVALGVSQSKAALAAWPQAQRAALRSAQRMQLISGLDASIDLKLYEGLISLKDAVKHAAPRLAPVLDNLALSLSSHVAWSPQVAGGPLSHRAMVLRTSHAEQLEARGEYNAAADIYKSVISDVVRNPSLHLVDSPPRMWSYYGLALKRAGRLAEAEAAYETGLRILPSCRIMPDTPQVREAYRVELLTNLVYLHMTVNHASMNAAVERLFCTQINALMASGEKSYSVDCINDALVLIGRTTRRRFTVEIKNVPDDKTGRPVPHARIVEVHQGWQPVRAGAGDEEDDDLRMARSTLQRQGQLPKLPQLPRGRCAACGEEATKRCGACAGPFYCSAACQRGNWRAHRAACKAASQ
jgi:hypothetical protein